MTMQMMVGLMVAVSLAAAQVQSLPGGAAAPITSFQVFDFQPLLTWLQRYF